jgi:putative salt-induced outer membrane protein YdiY
VAPAPPPKHWTGSIGLGVVAVTGNARSLTAALAAAAEHKGESWIFGGKAYATYGESRAAGTSNTQTSAENAGLFLRGDYRINPRLSAYVLGGIETDHVKSIEVRYSEEVGVGYAWLDWAGGDQKVFLRTDAGFRLAEEYRFQYYPVSARLDPRDFFFKGPRLGAAFRWQMNKTVLFSEDVEVLPNLGDSRVLVNSVSKLSAKLFGPMAIGIGYTVNYDSAPPAPKIPWDTTLAITLDYLL